jgi:hypothetical protein
MRLQRGSQEAFQMLSHKETLEGGGWLRSKKEGVRRIAHFWE